MHKRWCRGVANNNVTLTAISLGTKQLVTGDGVIGVLGRRLREASGKRGTGVDKCFVSFGEGVLLLFSLFLDDDIATIFRREKLRARHWLELFASFVADRKNPNSELYVRQTVNLTEEFPPPRTRLVSKCQRWAAHSEQA